MFHHGNSAGNLHSPSRDGDAQFQRSRKALGPLPTPVLKLHELKGARLTRVLLSLTEGLR